MPDCVKTLFVCGVLPQYTQEYARLYRLSQSWQSMKQKITVGQELAERTLAYWQTAPIRVLVCVECSFVQICLNSSVAALLDW